MDRHIKTDRSKNYDFLRIVCTIAVIMIHVSSSYKDAYMDINVFGKLCKDHLLVTCIYNLVPRFAVPCFIMLSGAFILSDDRNADYYVFWEKKIKRIGRPTVLFSCGYFLYDISEVLCKGGGIETEKIGFLFRNFVKGNPYYHMWYMYMMIGVYFLAPFIVQIKINISEKDFEKFGCIFTIWASLSSWTSRYLLSWDLGRAFLYMGYFMLGYIIRNRTKNKRNNLLGICLILSGITIELATAYVQYIHILQGIAEKDEVYALILPQTPWIVCASIFVFYGFSFLDIKRYYKKLSFHSFYIYRRLRNATSRINTAFFVSKI